MDVQSIPGSTDLLAKSTRNMNSTGLMKEIVSLCPDAIIGVDRKGIITIFNEAAETTTGWSRNEVVGRMPISELYDSKTIARDIKNKLYREELGGRGRLEGYETLGKTRDGRTFPIRLSAILLFEDGEEVGSVGFFHDLTPRKSLEQELLKLSITDSLTGLYNHRHFAVTLRDEAIRAKRYRRPLSIVLFDLDYLKLYNDTFGHLEGDNVLRLTARCAHEAIRANDYAFRQGGDEFALLLVETDLKGGLQVSERFRKTFNEQWALSLSPGKQGLRPVSLSLGVAECHLEENIENMLVRADMAMYAAKRSGGDRTMEAAGHRSGEATHLSDVSYR